MKESGRSIEKAVINNKSYIIYDGDCSFCNKAIIYIAKRDKKDCFLFVSGCSKFGEELLKKYYIKGLEKHTIILIEREAILTKSAAVRKILLRLALGYQFIGKLIGIFPKNVADGIYEFISKRRKSISSNHNSCEAPSAEVRRKFIV